MAVTGRKARSKFGGFSPASRKGEGFTSVAAGGVADSTPYLPGPIPPPKFQPQLNPLARRLPSRHGWLAAVLLLVITVAAFAQEKVTYDDQVTPILRNSCFKCHNPDKAKGDLDLSTFSAVLKGGGSGKAVLPGDPDGSKLFKTIARTEEPFMPANAPPLPEAEIAMIRKWIAGGLLEKASSSALAAPKPKFALQPGRATQGKPEGPPVMPVDWIVDPVAHTEQTNAVTALAANPWWPVVAVGGQHQLLLYDGATLQLTGVLPFPEGQPTCVQFSRDGRLLLVGGGRGGQFGFADLLDLATGERIARVGKEFDAVLAADLNSDQTEIALGGPGKRVKVYALRDGQLLYDLKKHTDWVTAIQYSPDSVLLATGDRNGGLVVWEADSGQELYTLTGHQAAITAVSWRDDSDLLISASEDGSIRVWEMREGRQAATWTAHKEGVLDARFGHDGRIVSCGRDRQMVIWDAAGAKQRQWEAGRDLPVRVTFNHDGTRVLASSWSGWIGVWSSADAKPAGEIASNPPTLAEQLEVANREAQTRLAAAVKAEETVGGATAEVAKLKTALAAHDRGSPAFQFLDATRQAQAAQRKAADEATRALDLLKTAAARSGATLAAAEADLTKTQAALEKVDKLSEPFKQITAQIEAAAAKVASANPLATQASKALEEQTAAAAAVAAEFAAKIPAATQAREQAAAPLEAARKQLAAAAQTAAQAHAAAEREQAAVVTQTTAFTQAEATLAAADAEAVRLAQALAASDPNSPAGQELAKQAEAAAQHVAAARTAHAESRKTLDELKAVADRSVAACTTADAEAAKAKTVLDPLEQEYRKASEQAASLEAARLAAAEQAAAENKTLQAAAAQAASALAAAQKEVADLQARLAQTEKHSDAFKQLSARLEEIGKQVAAARPPAEHDREEVAALQAALEKIAAASTASEAESARTLATLIRNDASYQRFQELEKQAERAGQRAEAARAAAAAARREAEAAQAVVARLKAAQAHAEWRRARQTLEARQRDHEQAAAALAAAEDENARITKELAAAQARLAELSAQIGTLSQQSNRTAAQLTNALATAAAVAREVAAQKERVEKLAAEHQRLQAIPPAAPGEARK